jgi:hypothetical protein
MSKGQTISMAKTFADLSVSFTEEKQKLKYVYDYSVSTYLIIEFLQDIPFYSKSTVGKGNDHVYMIIRNSLPDFPCDFCSKEKGKFFCFHCEQYFGLRCHDLKKRHKCGEEKDATNSVVSVVNSPRFGCCCYRGSQYGEEQSEFVVPFIETAPSLSSSSSMMPPTTAGSQFAPSSSLVDQVQSRTSSIGERRSSQEFRTFSWNSFEQMNNNNNNNTLSKNSSTRNSITGVNNNSNNSSSLTSPLPSDSHAHHSGHDGQINNGQGNENESVENNSNNNNNNNNQTGGSWGFWKWAKG